jgi:hypothetical protein
MGLKSAAGTQILVVLCAAICIPLLVTGCWPHGELTYEQAKESGLDHGPYSVYVDDGGPGNPIITVSVGQENTRSITIENYGDLADSYTIDVSSSPGVVVDTTGVPHTLALKAGEEYELVLHFRVPVGLPDHKGEVQVVVVSQISPNNAGECMLELRADEAPVVEPTSTDTTFVR